MLISAGEDKEVYFYSLDQNDFSKKPLILKEVITSLVLDENSNQLLIGD